MIIERGGGVSWSQSCPRIMKLYWTKKKKTLSYEDLLFANCQICLFSNIALLHGTPSAGCQLIPIYLQKILYFENHPTFPIFSYILWKFPIFLSRNTTERSTGIKLKFFESALRVILFTDWISFMCSKASSPVRYAVVWPMVHVCGTWYDIRHIVKVSSQMAIRWCYNILAEWRCLLEVGCSLNVW